MNVNVNVNYTARATLQYKAQKETPGPAQAFSRRLVGIGVIFVADNFTGVQFSYEHKIPDDAHTHLMDARGRPHSRIAPQPSCKAPRLGCPC